MHAALIQKLDGPKAVAERLGEVSEAAVYKWGKRGIPWKWRRAVAAIAREKRIRLPADFLGQVPEARAS